jgi:DNA repair protein SbcC/Rad50
MIPRRVRLSGFLSYKDEQEIVFDGSPLWMLAGLNGSGKSSIFDAVTYALFGHHRGGARDADQLINKDSRALAVDFEFLIEGQTFQIRRTLRRDAKGGFKGTQNVLRQDGATNKWLPIADTNLSDGFKAWVREKIGLNYETFTSSVLLLQGRAEKLLDSKPSGRAEVLAGIVDLERYQKLHEKADTRRKAVKAKLEAIQGQISGVPEVADFELLAAENAIYDAEQARDLATKEVDRLQTLEFEAKRWTESQARLEGLKSRWEKAQTLIAESAAIEQAYQRLRELRDVIPHVLVIQEKQLAIAESERASNQLIILKDQADATKANVDGAIDLARKKRAAHQKSLMQDEEHSQRVSVRLRDLTGPLSQVRLFEEQTATLKQLDGELARLPANVAETVRLAQETFDLRVNLGTVVPILDRFANARTQLRDATGRAESLQKAEKATLAAGAKEKDVHASLKTQLDSAVATRQTAADAATEAKTLLQQARGALDEFGQLEGSRVCRTCGQALTPAHWATEKATRDREVKNAGIRHRDSVRAQETAVAAETTVRDQFDAAENALHRLREEYRDTKKEAEQAVREVSRLNEECSHAFHALPERYSTQIRVSSPIDWLASDWPAVEELRSLRAEAGELDASRIQLRNAQTLQTKFDKLYAERQAAHTTLEQVKRQLPAGDPAGLREEESRLRAEEEAVNSRIRGTKKLLQENELEVERLSRELSGIEKTLATLGSQINVEEANRAQHRDAIDRASKLLPENWRSAANKAGLAEQNRWKTELDELNRKGVEGRHSELALTRASIETTKQDMGLATDEASRFSQEARRPPAEVKAVLLAAKSTTTVKDEDLQKAREAKAILDRNRQERDRLRSLSLELDRDLNYSSQLAQLLSRDRLQRHLVRTAERQIVDYANGILDRLSGGQLYLRLVGTDDGTATEKALDLEAQNRVTGGSAINVAFLSGSQRFRVAVSLALGMGQYASRQHRPIESVIIDEGFGCLDRNGRQVMIQELQNLRGQLKCILLVSHQEEFADAFADGYRFELENGATKISRFQR